MTNYQAMIWQEAIRRAMGQEEYGFKSTCVFCQMVGYRISFINIKNRELDCPNCLCAPYLRYLNKHHPDRWPYWGSLGCCAYILAENETDYPRLTWQDVAEIREHLQRMSELLEEDAL
jgi:hypothetical protein